MNRTYLIALVLVTTATLEMSDVRGQQSAADDEAALLQPYRQAAIERWESAIAALEALDSQQPDPADGILFVGSSSIRLWRNIVTDMAPYRPIRRGYGGARFSDVAVFAKRLIHPHQYRALVIFVANDVVGRPTDLSPDQVEALVRYIVGVSHAHQNDAPVFLIEITPTKQRFAAWPKIREVNARLREIALSTPDTHFIPTAEHYLDPSGNPRTELFVEDQLHLNAAGYQLWSELIRRQLDDQLRIRTQFEVATAHEAASERTTGETSSGR